MLDAHAHLEIEPALVDEAVQAAQAARTSRLLDGRDAIPNDRTHFPDGQHPGDAGHRAMGRWLAKQLAARGWLQ